MELSFTVDECRLGFCLGKLNISKVSCLYKFSNMSNLESYVSMFSLYNKIKHTNRKYGYNATF